MNLNLLHAAALFISTFFLGRRAGGRLRRTPNRQVLENANDPIHKAINNIEDPVMQNYLRSLQEPAVREQNTRLLQEILEQGRRATENVEENQPFEGRCLPAPENQVRAMVQVGAPRLIVRQGEPAGGRVRQRFIQGVAPANPPNPNHSPIFRPATWIALGFSVIGVLFYRARNAQNGAKKVGKQD